MLKFEKLKQIDKKLKEVIIFFKKEMILLQKKL